MKSKSLIAGIAGFLVAAGAYFVVGQMEAGTEQAVRDTLAQTPLKAEGVDYALFSKKLTLTGVSFDATFESIKIAEHIDSMVLTDFNPDCLKPVAAGTRPALVASDVLATGITGTTSVTVDGPDGKPLITATEISAASLTMKNWYENLGSLIAEYRKNGLSEAFWAEMYYYSVESMVYTDYKTVSNEPNVGLLTVSTASLGLLAPAGSLTDPMAGRTLSLYMDKMEVGVNGARKAALDRVEMDNLLFPSPKGMVECVALYPALIAAPQLSDEAQARVGEDLLAILKREYSEKAPYSRMAFKGSSFVVPEESGGEIRIENLEHTLALGDPFRLGLHIQGVRIPEALLPEPYAATVKAFAPGGLLLDGLYDVALRPAASGASSAEWTNGVQTLGSLASKVEFLLDVDKLSDMLDDGFSKDRFCLLSSFDSTYRDSGLAALALALAALAENTTPEDLLGQIRTEMLPLLGGMDNGIGLAAAVETLLDKPGALTVQLRPENPVALEDASMMLLMDPLSLHPVVKAEPGPKPLLDYMPAALKK